MIGKLFCALHHRFAALVKVLGTNIKRSADIIVNASVNAAELFLR